MQKLANHISRPRTDPSSQLTIPKTRPDPNPRKRGPNPPLILSPTCVCCRLRKRSASASLQHRLLLTEEPEVAWFEQQEERSRKKRDGGAEGRNGFSGQEEEVRIRFTTLRRGMRNLTQELRTFAQKIRCCCVCYKTYLGKYFWSQWEICVLPGEKNVSFRNRDCQFSRRCVYGSLLRYAMRSLTQELRTFAQKKHAAAAYATRHIWANISVRNGKYVCCQGKRMFHFVTWSANF